MNMNDRFLRFLLVLIFIAAAIETDLYLPSFPDLMEHFGCTELMVQRVLSFNFLGICIGSLFYGPLSDSFGRKKVLSFGYVLFILGSWGCVIATQIEQLLLWRFLQGLGSAACFIIGTACIFDFYKARKAAAVMGQLNTLVASTMAFAPMVGGWFNFHYGFQSNFLFILVLSVFSALACFFWLPESLPRERRKPFDLRGILRSYKKVISCYSFWVYALFTTFIFAGYMLYIANMPLIYVNQLKVPEEIFPWYQFVILGAFVISSTLSGSLIKKYGLDRLTNIGVLLLAMSSFLLFLGIQTWYEKPLVMNSFMMIYSFGSGLCMGIFFTKAMEACPGLTGVSSSVVGSVRLVFTSLIVDFAGVFYDGTMIPVVYVITLIMFISTFLFVSEKLRKN